MMESVALSVFKALAVTLVGVVTVSGANTPEAIPVGDVNETEFTGSGCKAHVGTIDVMDETGGAASCKGSGSKSRGAKRMEEATRGCPVAVVAGTEDVKRWDFRVG